MGRHEKRVAQARHRASVARFRRESEGTLRTYLVSPDDAGLDSIPILKRATRSWLENLKARVRRCIVCSSWIPDQYNVGAVLLSTPDIETPKAVAISGICLACWADDRETLEKASMVELCAALPGGHFID